MGSLVQSSFLTLSCLAPMLVPLAASLNDHLGLSYMVASRGSRGCMTISPLRQHYPIWRPPTPVGEKLSVDWLALVDWVLKDREAFDTRAMMCKSKGGLYNTLY